MLSIHHKRKTLFVSGVCCSTEEAIFRKTLNTLISPERYTFNPTTCELSLHPSIDDQQVVRSLSKAGFGTHSKEELDRDRSFWEHHADAISTGIAALLAIAGMIIEGFEGSFTVSRVLLLSAIIVGGWKIAFKAYVAAKSRSLDINVLMSLAVIGALSIGKWSEGAAVIVLFAVSLALESYSAARTRNAIRSLMSVAPTQASVLYEGKERAVHAKNVTPGDIIMIRPGERIPLDGIIVEGHSAVDESPITGESLPVVKQLGSGVFAGSINQRGSLRVRVTRRFEETTIARIIHMVEEAYQRRAPVQHLVDRFARIYTPVVLGVAVLTVIVPPLLFQQSFGTWFYRALVLLVIACPCALVISTPVTIVSALTWAARRGILIKGGKHIETLSKVESVAFDKTGTLTEGKTRVTDVVPLDSLSREEIVQLAAAIEQHSEHHLAAAILIEAERLGVSYQETSVDAFQALPGLGVTASIDGTTYYLGNHKLYRARGYRSPLAEQALEGFSRQGKTAIVVGRDSDALGIIAIQDTARHQSRIAIERLKKMGINHMTILSGDHQTIVERIARDVGVINSAAGLLPAQKVAFIEELKHTHTTVAMVGDGINDAPALAASSVGIAMGVSGTDAALETADVVLMTDDLSKLPTLFGLSRTTLSIVKQNIFLALSLKLLFLILTVVGSATLWMAVLADDGAALCVILNGLRILAHKDES